MARSDLVCESRLSVRAIRITRSTRSARRLDACSTPADPPLFVPMVTWMMSPATEQSVSEPSARCQPSRQYGTRPRPVILMSISMTNHATQTFSSTKKVPNGLALASSE